MIFFIEFLQRNTWFGSICNLLKEQVQQYSFYYGRVAKPLSNLLHIMLSLECVGNRQFNSAINGSTIYPVNDSIYNGVLLT